MDRKKVKEKEKGSQAEGKETQSRGKMVHFGTFFSPWAHLGPLGNFKVKQPARLVEL